MTGGGWLRLALALGAHSIRHPSDGLALLRVGWRFRRRGWYASLPFLPLPDREYMRWRMYTAYGNEDAVPPIDDIVRYSRWATRNP